MSIGKLTSVTVSGPLTLWLGWDDGHIASVDLADVLARTPALAPLADEFASVTLSVDHWSVEWPCGIDFGSAQLRRWADEQAGNAMAPASFRAWLARHQLTLDSAAAALGLSRRTIAYYLSGEQVIPKTVLLATEGYDQRRRAA
jgi:hypothetical protein